MRTHIASFNLGVIVMSSPIWDEYAELALKRITALGTA